MQKVFLSILLISPFVMAGKATLTGTADVSAKNDYVEFNLTVRSECYKTPKEAKDANNGLVVSIQNILNNHQDVDSEFDKVYVSGGWVGQFSDTVYENDESRTICKNTYQKTTVITFKTGDVDNFSEMYDTIQDEVLKLELKQGALEDPRDAIDLSTPSADICEKTTKDLENQAYAEAVEDARRKFEACSFGGGIACTAKIVNMTDHEPTYAVAESYAPAAPDMKRAFDNTVQLSFPDRHLRRNVKVEFTYSEAGQKNARKREQKRQSKMRRAEIQEQMQCFHHEDGTIEE